jgi:hypothetical protein
MEDHLQTTVNTLSDNLLSTVLAQPEISSRAFKAFEKEE